MANVFWDSSIGGILYEHSSARCIHRHVRPCEVAKPTDPQITQKASRAPLVVMQVSELLYFYDVDDKPQEWERSCLEKYNKGLFTLAPKRHRELYGATFSGDCCGNQGRLRTRVCSSRMLGRELDSRIPFQCEGLLTRMLTSEFECQGVNAKVSNTAANTFNTSALIEC